MANKIKDSVGIKPELRDSLMCPKHTDAVAAVAAPTQAEFNALVTSYNSLLSKLRTAGILDS
jgi:hypothetical protein